MAALNCEGGSSHRLFALDDAMAAVPKRRARAPQSPGFWPNQRGRNAGKHLSAIHPVPSRREMVLPRLRFAFRSRPPELTPQIGIKTMAFTLDFARTSLALHPPAT